jgi:hypothetical protein
MPAIRVGDKLVIIDKKLFRDDNTRVFVGVVEEFDEGAMRTRGVAYHINPYEVAGTERGGDERVRIIPLTGDSLFYVLPQEVEISRLQLKRSPKMMVLTDGSMTLDLSDWMLRG